MSSEIEKLEQAIAALEGQRGILGDGVVDAALGPLREKMASLQAAQGDEASDDSQRRKQVSVLFMEIPGMAALTDALDAEDWRDTVNELWQRLDAAVLAFGGRVDKHMGYGVMALWGADSVNEDDPEQAIRAALELRAVLSEFCAQSAVLSRFGEISLRAGINSGTAIVGRLGMTGEFTALGDTVNLAARLNQSAAPGEILISHDTYRLVRGVFDVETKAPIMVKGKSEPVRCYKVRQAKPRAFHIFSRGVEGVETSLVGRQAEMETLQAAYFSIFRDKRPQVLTIFGDMGLGKTRLVQDFMTWNDPREEDYYLFQARSLPSQVTSPYSFLRDLFAFRFQIQDSDSLETVLQKLEQGFAFFMPADGHAQEEAQVVGHLLGYKFPAAPSLRSLLDDPRQLRSLGLTILRRFFGSAARQLPVILILEDIHWADSASLDALTHVFSNLHSYTPLLALCTSRPALAERYPSWAESFPNASRLELRPLTRDDSRALVGQILQKVDNLPSALRELIVGGAEGNPFYLEELVKMLIDGRVIQPAQDAWRVDIQRLDAVAIPPTLAGVLQARLDTLDALERASLQRASVVGRIFWDRALEALSPEVESERERLQACLSVLRTKELIFPNPVSTFSGTQEFSFKHALLRDVAYETVLKRQRAQYHSRVAEWLDRVSGERRGEYLPIIAEHYEKAGEADRASKALIEAGDHALRLSAFSEAFRFFQRALNLVPGERRRDLAYLQVRIGEIFLRSGEYGDALKYTEKALAVAGSLSEGNLLASSLYQAGQIYAEMGNYPQAETCFLQALSISRALGPRGEETLGRVLYGLGNVHWRLGKLDSAFEHCAESRDISHRVADMNTHMLALNRLGVLSGLRGDPIEEERLYRQVLSLAVSLGNRERAGLALNNLGALADEKGDYKKAQDYYLQAMQMAREISAQQSIALYLINLAHSEIRLGDFGSALEHLREGLALADHLKAYPWVLTGVIFFAELEVARGNPVRALEMLGLSEHHSAYSVDHQRLCEQVLRAIDMPEDLVVQHMGRGACLDWAATFTQILMT
jgi:class 3 adenylate cyclase/tetratricopeptide (TPR) repeat protein